LFAGLVVVAVVGVVDADMNVGVVVWTTTTSQHSFGLLYRQSTS
jgi:hypothetical protein